MDSRFNHCFYFECTSYLRHFNETRDAIQPQLDEQQIEEYRAELKQMLSHKNWERLVKQDYVFGGDKYMKHLIALFEADKRIRQDYAALYRTFRTLGMSRQDSDKSSQGLESEQNMRSHISKLFASVLGCSNEEERILKHATEIVYPTPQPHQRASGLRVKHYFHNSSAVQKFEAMAKQARHLGQSSAADLVRLGWC